METLELRGDDLFMVSEKKLDGVDPEREIAMVEAQITELNNRLKILKSYKFKKDVKK